MIGANKAELNTATMVAAIQHYFDTVLFKEGKAPKVTGVSSASGVRGCFEVHLNSPTEVIPPKSPDTTEAAK